MSFLKLNGVVCTALVAFALLSAGSQAAQADTTKLICSLSNSPNAEDGPTTIELNEAQSSVVVHFSGYHVRPESGLQGGGGAPRSIGPLSATFSDDTITFSNPQYPQQDQFKINRLTGELTNTITNWKWACEKGQKKF